MDKSFHLRPPLGWINDPNGFSRSNDGLYHLFYQHNPHNRRWWELGMGFIVLLCAMTFDTPK
jgi:beta-fructofuranosidase